MGSNNTDTSIVQILWYGGIKEWCTQDAGKDLDAVHVRVVEGVDGLGDGSELDAIGGLGHAAEHGLRLPGASPDLVAEMILAIDSQWAVELVHRGGRADIGAAGGEADLGNNGLELLKSSLAGSGIEPVVLPEGLFEAPAEGSDHIIHNGLGLLGKGSLDKEVSSQVAEVVVHKLDTASLTARGRTLTRDGLLELIEGFLVRLGKVDAEIAHQSPGKVVLGGLEGQSLESGLEAAEVELPQHVEVLGERNIGREGGLEDHGPIQRRGNLVQIRDLVPDNSVVFLLFFLNRFFLALASFHFDISVSLDTSVGSLLSLGRSGLGGLGCFLNNTSKDLLESDNIFSDLLPNLGDSAELLGVTVALDDIEHLSDGLLVQLKEIRILVQLLVFQAESSLLGGQHLVSWVGFVIPQLPGDRKLESVLHAISPHVRQGQAVGRREDSAGAVVRSWRGVGDGEVVGQPLDLVLEGPAANLGESGVVHAGAVVGLEFVKVALAGGIALCDDRALGVVAGDDRADDVLSEGRERERYEHNRVKIRFGISAFCILARGRDLSEGVRKDRERASRSGPLTIFCWSMETR